MPYYTAEWFNFVLRGIIEMGVQTDVVAAKRSDAQIIADSDSPASLRNGFTFNGFDRVQLCTLLSAIKSGDPSSEFNSYLDAIEVVNCSTDEWPTVSIVNLEQISMLASVAEMDESEFEKLASSWAATEEFEGWTVAEVLDLLRQLTDLAESASLTGDCLMIWETM